MSRNVDNSIDSIEDNARVAEILAELVKLQYRQTALLDRLRSINYKAALKQHRVSEREDSSREHERTTTGAGNGRGGGQQEGGQQEIKAGDFVRFVYPTPGLADTGRVTRIDSGMYVVESPEGRTILTSLQNLALDSNQQEARS